MVNTDSFEYYSDLEELGRCGVACANKAKRMAYRKISESNSGWVFI